MLSHVVAVTRLGYGVPKHALPTPREISTWGEALCGEKVFPLAILGGAAMPFAPESGTCQDCCVAFALLEPEEPHEHRP